MDKTPNDPFNTSQAYSPWVLLLILSGFVIIGLILFSLLGQGIIMGLFDLSLEESLDILSRPDSYNNSKFPLMLLQGITSIGAFILVPLLFVKLNISDSLISFFKLPNDSLRPILMTIVILFCFMVANSVVIEWNQNLVMPEFLSGFEDWALAKEDQLKELTVFLTSFDNFGEYLIALVVIALVPAIGEELLFRGLIQKLFGRALKNHHLAIWISAIIFGVFHMQFYGVIPRIFLGALFGYLYYWSGHLSLAMVGHFMNNGLTLTLLYFSQLKFLSYDITDTQSSPPIYVVGLFFVAGAILLYLFRNLFSLKNA